VTAAEAYKEYFRKMEGKDDAEVHYIIIDRWYYESHSYHRGWIDEMKFRWASAKDSLAVEAVG